MKKTYFHPAIDTMRIETVCMNTASMGKDSATTLGDADEGTFLGRERRSHDVWGDDEEE